MTREKKSSIGGRRRRRDGDGENKLVSWYETVYSLRLLCLYSRILPVRCTTLSRLYLAYNAASLILLISRRRNIVAWRNDVKKAEQ